MPNYKTESAISKQRMHPSNLSTSEPAVWCKSVSRRTSRRTSGADCPSPGVGAAPLLATADRPASWRPAITPAGTPTRTPWPWRQRRGGPHETPPPRPPSPTSRHALGTGLITIFVISRATSHGCQSYCGWWKWAASAFPVGSFYGKCFVWMHMGRLKLCWR